MKNKKILTIGAILLIIFGVGGWLVFSRGNNTTPSEEASNKKRISEPTNVITVAERPYLKIMPLADGRNIEIVVENIKKSAAEAEYELEYQAGTLLQGAFGSINIATLPATEKILLGSCSAGGACTYHEDVRGGSLLTRFSGTEESYALKSDWRYFDNKAKETEFSSKDDKFQIVSDDLSTQKFLVIFNTAGYPEGLSGEVVSDPYSLTSSSALKGTAQLTMRSSEEGELKIMGWDGKEWIEFEGTVDGKMIDSAVDLMELYVVVR